MQISMQLDTSKLQGKLLRLQASIKYEEGDVAGTRQFLEQSAQDDPDTIVNHGCLLYLESKYDDAARKFQEALNITGPRPFLSYNITLCFYRLKQYAMSLKHIADIIEKGIREHPELSVGMTTEGVEVRSVGNTKVCPNVCIVHLVYGIDEQPRVLALFTMPVVCVGGPVCILHNAKCVQYW